MVSYLRGLMKPISITCTQNQIEKLITTFKDNQTPAPAYALFQCKVEGCVITIYNSKKVVFQGVDASIYASPFMDSNHIFSHAGSDEVGTGDYFGPVCVCACLVESDHIEALEKLHVQDSKAITDSIILQIAPQIMKLCTHSLLILENKKYNEIQKQNNLNAIKAKLHNQAYVHLSQKKALPKLVVVDQFTPEKSYYNYLIGEKTIIKNLHFETKAENKYLAVACASIIARYAFLKTWEEMEKRYQMTFTKGASDLVDQNAAQFVSKYGFEKLHLVAKIHFKNTEKMKQYL